MYHSKLLHKLVVAIAVSLILAFSSVVSAKSLYLISDINASPTPIRAYDVQPDGTLVFQFEGTVPAFAWGAVGIAADAISKTLFITYEQGNTIQLVNAVNLADLGTTTAPGATNLSGIVYDHSNGLLYAVDRTTSNLYVYSWDASTSTLTLLSGGGTGPEVLPGLSAGGAYGITLDEINGLLYVGDTDNTVNYYNTIDWSLAGTLNIGGIGTPRVISVAVDAINGQLYTGGSFFGDPELRKHDIASDTTTTSVTASVIGLAVDPIQGNVYATTGFTVDTILAYDMDLASLQTAIALPGDPTGLVVPEISFNPLAFSKTDSPDPVASGSNLTYTVCYDNSANIFDVTNVVITDDIPTGTTFVSATGPFATTPTTVTWSVGTVLAGAAQVCYNLVVNVTAAEGATILNSATIDSTETPPTTQTTITDVTAGVVDDGGLVFVGEGDGGGASTGPMELLFGLLLLPLVLARRLGRTSSLFVLAMIGVVFTMTVTTTVIAADNDWYLGGGIGGVYTDAEGSDYDADLLRLGFTASSSIDDTTFGWKLFAGYHLNKTWDIELGYADLGDVESRTVVSAPPLPTAVEQQQFVNAAATVHPYSVDAISLVGKGNWPVNNDFTVFGKLGIFYWQADILVQCVGCATGVASPDDESGTDWTGGLGVHYKYSDKIGLRFEYDRYNTDRNDMDFVSIGLQYEF